MPHAKKKPKPSCLVRDKEFLQLLLQRHVFYFYFYFLYFRFLFYNHHFLRKIVFLLRGAVSPFQRNSFFNMPLAYLCQLDFERIKGLGKLYSWHPQTLLTIV